MPNVEALQSRIEWDYEKAYYLQEEIWAERLFGCNEGQQSIYEGYIWPAVEDTFGVWAEDWPWVESYDYYDYTMGSHYAAEQCWSDTTLHVTDQLERIIQSAQEKAFLMELIGFFF
jgi:hypothetical protein